MRNIDENAPKDVIRVLIGNKSDLHHRVVVSTENGKQLADKFGVDFFETSAKSDSNENILKIFSSITEKILDQNQPITKPPIIKLEESTNLLDSSYGKLIGCCSSATTIVK
jgi:GTPase SAR1 family protein